MDHTHSYSYKMHYQKAYAALLLVIIFTMLPLLSWTLTRIASAHGVAQPVHNVSTFDRALYKLRYDARQLTNIHAPHIGAAHLFSDTSLLKLALLGIGGTAIIFLSVHVLHSFGSSAKK